MKIVDKKSQDKDIVELEVNMVTKINPAGIYKFIFHTMDAFRVTVFNEFGGG